MIKIFHLYFVTIIFFSFFSISGLAQESDDARKQGKEIYQKYLAATGGKEAQEKIKIVETIAEVQTGGVKRKVTSIVDNVNNRNYSKSEGGVEGIVESGFDGKRFWQKSNSFRGYRDFNIKTTSVEEKNPQENYLKLPNEIIDGKEYLVLQHIPSKTNFYYYPDTFLLFRRSGQLSFNNAEIKSTFHISYADYRKVGDLMVPFLETTSGLIGGMGTTIRKIISVRHNPEIDPKIFEFSDGENKEEPKKPETSNDSAKRYPQTLQELPPFKSKDDVKKALQDVLSKAEFNPTEEVLEKNFSQRNPNLLAIGTEVPDFTSTFLDGSKIQLSQLRGKVVVMNFWSVLCGPCRAEIPELNEIARRFKGEDVVFIGITTDFKKHVTQFLEKYTFDYKQITDAVNIVNLYEANPYPYHLILDKEGKVLFSQSGYNSGTQKRLMDKIDSALGGWDKKNPNAILPEKIKKDAFERVWSTINSSYWDPSFNGVDWNVVKKKYEPRLSEPQIFKEFIAFLNQMIGELKQSHTKIIPLSNVAIDDKPTEMSKTGKLGFSVRWLNNAELVATEIVPNSPAAQAGIKKGYVIKKIDGETIESLIENQKKTGEFKLREELVAVRAISAKTSGHIEKPVALTFIDEKEVEKTIQISRKNLGIFPELVFEAKELNENAGYIKFNMFTGDLPIKFAEAVATMKNKKGLIIDLRGNPGGIANHTTALAALLDKEKRSLGTTQKRYGKSEFNYEGNEQSYQGKVIILIDELSGSSSEILAAGLQEHKRAIIVGQTSAGAVLASLFETLPHIGGLQYPIGNYQTPQGKILEGNGVKPNFEVKLTRKDLLNGRDPFLEVALKLVD